MKTMETGQDRAKRLLEVALRNGIVISADPGERKVCARLNARQLLLRDKKSADTWYPSHKAKVLQESRQQTGLRTAILPPDERIAFRRPIASIDIGDRLRITPDRTIVESLKVSIPLRGLRTPISVQGKESDERVRLSAGLHRLTAMIELGETTIACFHDDDDDLDRELWEIDENLCRAELTPADRALFVFRRKEIYLLKNPETTHGGDRRSSRQVGDLKPDAQRFTTATAVATGQSERVIQRDASRGEKIVDRALHRLRGTRLDSGAFLDRLKQVAEDKQLLYVEAALADEKRKAADVKENRRKLQEVRHSVRLAHMAHVTSNGAATVGQVATRFPVIYADPPWKFGVHSEVTGREKSPENHYPTMTTHEICALWEQIGSPAKRDAVLFLWATNPMLPDALRVMDAWGFAYVHHWIWDKEVAGTGYWGRDRHELLLIGRRGEPAAPLPGSQPNTVHREAKGRHSAKPAFFAETIERLYPDMPRLEMFCRDPRPGWTAWGYEAAASESEVA